MAGDEITFSIVHTVVLKMNVIIKNLSFLISYSKNFLKTEEKFLVETFENFPEDRSNNFR